MKMLRPGEKAEILCVCVCAWELWSNHACRAAGWINQPKNRTAGIHAHFFLGSCDQSFTVSCIVPQFARESFGICRFRGSYMREYDLI